MGMQGLCPCVPIRGCTPETLHLEIAKILDFRIKSGFSLSKRGSRGIAPCGADGATPRHAISSPKGWGLGGLKLD